MAEEVRARTQNNTRSGTVRKRYSRDSIGTEVSTEADKDRAGRIRRARATKPPNLPSLFYGTGVRKTCDSREHN